MWNKRTETSMALIFLLSSIWSLAEGGGVEILPLNSPADLDLSGNIVYAINFGNNGNPQFGEVVFSQDQDCPDVTFTTTAEGESSSWQGLPPNTGDSNLDMLLHGVTWQNSGGSVTTSITAGELILGMQYQLQLIFYTDHTRPMDIVVDGDIIIEHYDPFPAQGWVQGKGGSIVKHNFTAGDATMNIDITARPDDGSTASVISGLILSEVPLATLSKARKPIPADGAIHENTWANLGWTPGFYAASHDVYFGDNFGNVNTGVEGTFQGNQGSTFFVAGFPGFAFPDGLVPGTTYYWRIDEANDTEPNSPWKGPVWNFSIPPKTAYFPDPADSAESVDVDVQLSWTGGFGAKLHTVHFSDNFEDVNNATEGPPSGITTYTPGPLELEKIYYWRVDEFDAIDTYKGDVWSFATPGAVGSLNPANGATDARQTLILEWIAADSASSHELYLDTDKDAVRNADTSSPEYKGSMNLGSESYDVGSLEWDTTYYWRVDEVKADSTVQKGLIWSFTTANFLIVDDFESYNDLNPDLAGSNRILDVWNDGFGTTANGALVGNDFPPYAEQNIVHGGAQSMPYACDNDLKTSEATLTLIYPHDWTEKGVTKLSLWFRGGPDNATERLFVALDGNAVVYHDDPEVTKIDAWSEWVITLQDFADQGVDLTDVSTLTIGLGTKDSPAAGGLGQMYFDDIRLTR